MSAHAGGAAKSAAATPRQGAIWRTSGMLDWNPRGGGQVAGITITLFPHARTTPFDGSPLRHGRQRRPPPLVSPGRRRLRVAGERDGRGGRSAAARLLG